MPPVPICTIVSNNYLAFARVLAESYRLHHPGVEIFVCITDRPDPQVPYSSMPFETLFAEELPIPAFDNFAFRYDILELNTAVKPYLLAHLRDRYDLDRIFYFDPDILICDRLADLEEALDRHQAVLTPHLTRPIDNEHRPAERFIRQAGVYNLGFLGLRLDASTADFLDWWQDRLHRYCIVDLANGLFVDQSWMDLAPAYLEDVAIERDPIFNIAYWNLPHRRIEHVGGTWKVDGRKVGFFHFSGIDFENLTAISRHQNRITLDDRPDLRPCFESYRERVLAAGHDRLAQRPYGFGIFSETDIGIPPTTRRTLQRVDPLARRWSDPFDIRARDSFFHWLIEPIELGSGTLNRAVLSVWEERPDLTRYFPRVGDRDLTAFIGWLKSEGEAERAGLHPDFLRGLRSAPAKRRSRSRSATPPLPYEATVIRSARALLESVDLRRPGGLAKWLNEPIPGTAAGRPTLTYLSILVHQIRPDVQRVFPDPLGEDQTAFAIWFSTHAARELSLHPSLVRPVRRTIPILALVRHAVRAGSRRVRDWRPNSRLDPLSRPRLGRRMRSEPLDRSPATDAGSLPLARPAPADGAGIEGVNVVGYFEAPTGIGQMGRAALRGLAKAGIASAEIALDRDTFGRTIGSRLHSAVGMPYRVTLLHANADETKRALGTLPAAALARNFTIGYWFWELSHFPLAFADRFRYVDEVWAPSRFCESAFRSIASVPVRYVPPFVPAPEHEAADRRSLGLEEDRFYFFYAFDMLSVPERKNPRAAIEAVARLAKETSKKVGLLLKLSNATRAPEALRQLYRAASGVPVRFFTETTRRRTVEGMLGACDAVLSLHRSEGLGLLPIEALYLEKPVIATDYGGVTDFLDEETGFPVRYRLETLDRSHGPYPAGSVWADPEVGHAVERMQEVVENPQRTARTGAAGRERVEKLYGIEAAGARYRAELERVFAHLAR